MFWLFIVRQFSFFIRKSPNAIESMGHYVDANRRYRQLLWCLYRYAGLSSCQRKLGHGAEQTPNTQPKWWSASRPARSCPSLYKIEPARSLFTFIESDLDSAPQHDGRITFLPFHSHDLAVLVLGLITSPSL